MSKLDGFHEAKHRILQAIDYRIQQLPKNGGILRPEENRAVLERVDELRKLRSFVKGMVTEVESQSDTKLKLLQK